MGQRMQVVFSIENEKNEHKNVAYHLQWGIGRIMPSFVMQAGLGIIHNLRHGQKVYDALIGLRGGDALLLTDEEGDGFEEGLQKVDFRNIVEAGEWFSNQDNNNGGAVVYIKISQDPYHDTVESYTVKFLKGWEECYDSEEKPFSRWITYDEYRKADINARYCDDDFSKMFETFLEYYGED